MNYQPKYKKYWKEIDDSISQNWESSLIKSPKKLPFPFLTIAPNGREVIFYWDTYFTNAGLFFHQNTKKYAKNNVDDLLYEVEQYGFVPNSSESWGLNRSQPPYLSMMVRDVYEHSKVKDKEWLKKAYYTLRKEYHFWIDDSEKAIENHTTSIPLLLRYFHHAHSDELLVLYNEELTSRLGFDASISDEEKLKIGSYYAAEAESGMDFTPRFEGRCSDFVALDLNCNLFLYEKNFEWMINELGLKNQPKWSEKAEQRKKTIEKYLWDKERGLFMDYDFIHKRYSKVATVMTFSPLYSKIATKEQAEIIRDNLKLFEREWGISICEQKNQDREYQWGYPGAWPPMYYLVIKGLDNYGYIEDAKRIAAKYCDLVAKNYLSPEPLEYSGANTIYVRKPGAVYEKYNAADGTIWDAEYPADVFVGWSAGVFVFAYNYYLNH